jgi:hydrogenase nickel incorporation protein HypA/HybF
MHELAVTENILNIAIRNAENAHAARVTDIHLVIGALSSIVDDSVQFYWDMLSQDTICAGSKLHFQRLPARIICKDCHTEYEIQEELRTCPSCGSFRVRFVQGEEFFLESIEIEK